MKWVLSIVASLLLVVALGNSDTLVLKGGKRIEVQALQISGSYVVATLPGGSKSCYSVRDVDLEATRALATQAGESGEKPIGPSHAEPGQVKSVARLASELRTPEEAARADEEALRRFILLRSDAAADGDEPSAVQPEATQAEADPTKLEALKQFEADALSLAATKEELDRTMDEYNAGCRNLHDITKKASGISYDAQGRPYPITMDVSMPDPRTGNCSALWAKGLSLYRSVREGLEGAKGRAFLAGVYAGDLHGIVQRAGLGEFE